MSCVHLVSVVSLPPAWLPSGNFTIELPGSEFVLEYANPGLRFSIRCDSRALLQGFMLRMLLLIGYKVDEIRAVICCLLLDEKLRSCLAFGTFS